MTAPAVGTRWYPRVEPEPLFTVTEVSDTHVLSECDDHRAMGPLQLDTWDALVERGDLVVVE